MRVAAALLLLPGLVGLVGAAPASANSAAPAAVAPQPAVEHLCAPAAVGDVACLAELRTDIAARTRDAVSPDSPPSGYGPADLQSAYALTSAAAANGSGLTVAIVDAFDLPTAASDLAAYRTQFGLPACTVASGCFTKVDEHGGSHLPAADSGWGGEIALDIEMVSAICPRCHILLVEASSVSTTDVGTGVDTAVSAGAIAVSNSYGGNEDASEASVDAAYYDHPGVAVTASAGDDGYGTEFPAASPHVISVGGTSLSHASNARGWTETAWSGSGSGCSPYETKPVWQDDSDCAQRTLNDVSAVGDPGTGVAVYSAGFGGWAVAGGTSVGSPIIAATYALAGTPKAGTYPGSYPYLRGGLNDVTTGSDGSCGGSYLCTAGVGYDGPTGLGTPDGIMPFQPLASPGAPTAVAGTPGNASALVSWSAPASTGGSPISGYAATSAPGGKTCSTSGSLSCTVNGLTNGTAYTFTVKATNTSGTGPASAPSSPVTPRTVPGAPTGVSAAAGNAAALVSWSAPVSNGGSAITGYRATSAPGGKTCTTSGTLSCQVGSLTNGTAYTFAVAATNVAGTGPPSAASASVRPYAPKVTRLDNATYGDLAGFANDRYGTAAAIAEQAFGTGASTVYIASGADFPDALGASAAAAKAGGPVLLVTPTAIPAAIAHELTALHPTTIYLVGGAGSVSDAVLAALGAYAPKVTRLDNATYGDLAGFANDRYGTAAAIAEQAFGTGASTVYIASGADFPDALGASAAAAKAGGPVLLVTPTAIPAAIAHELTALHPTTIYLVGGAGSVSDAVLAALGAYAPKVTRLDNATYGDLAGFANDRYGTAAAIAEQAFGTGASTVYIASGADFPDALGASAAAAKAGGPVLLVTPTAIPAAIAHELTALHPTTIYLVGGAGSVSDAVLAALGAYLGP